MRGSRLLAAGAAQGAAAEPLGSGGDVPREAGQGEKEQQMRVLRGRSAQPRSLPRLAHLHPRLRKGTPVPTQQDYTASAGDFLRDHERKVREYEEEPEELVFPARFSWSPSRAPRTCTATSAARATRSTSR